MKIAILIHVHKKPAQVERLVKALQHEAVDIYLNVDKKADINLFKERIKDVIYIKERIKVRWAHFSQVQATINSLKEIGTTYDYVMFISGQDYPIKPMDYIIAQLENSGRKEFIQYKEICKEGWDAAHIYERYHFLITFRSVDRRLGHFIRKFIKRSYPLKTAYGGSGWWCLTTECVQYLLKYYSANKSFVNFHKHTVCADELFFHSIIVHSPFQKNIVNNNYRYIDWGEKKSNPKILEQSDFQKIMESDNWFARKFDTAKDSIVLDMIDDRIKKHPFSRTIPPHSS